MGPMWRPSGSVELPVCTSRSRMVQASRTARLRRRSQPWISATAPATIGVADEVPPNPLA